MVLLYSGIIGSNILTTPFSFSFGLSGAVAHGSPKKIKYLEVGRCEATNYEKIFYLRYSPQYPHKYMKVLTARLTDFAQSRPIPLASGQKEPVGSINRNQRVLLLLERLGSGSARGTELFPIGIAC